MILFYINTCFDFLSSRSLYSNFTWIWINLSLSLSLSLSSKRSTSGEISQIIYPSFDSRDVKRFVRLGGIVVIIASAERFYANTKFVKLPLQSPHTVEYIFSRIVAPILDDRSCDVWPRSNVCNVSCNRYTSTLPPLICKTSGGSSATPTFESSRRFYDPGSKKLFTVLSLGPEINYFFPREIFDTSKRVLFLLKFAKYYIKLIDKHL